MAKKEAYHTVSIAIPILLQLLTLTGIGTLAAFYGDFCLNTSDGSSNNHPNRYSKRTVKYSFFRRVIIHKTPCIRFTRWIGTVQISKYKTCNKPNCRPPRNAFAKTALLANLDPLYMLNGKHLYTFASIVPDRNHGQSAVRKLLEVAMGDRMLLLVSNPNFVGCYFLLFLRCCGKRQEAKHEQRQNSNNPRGEYDFKAFPGNEARQIIHEQTLSFHGGWFCFYKFHPSSHHLQIF